MNTHYAITELNVDWLSHTIHIFNKKENHKDTNLLMLWNKSGNSAVNLFCTCVVLPSINSRDITISESQGWLEIKQAGDVRLMRQHRGRQSCELLVLRIYRSLNCNQIAQLGKLPKFPFTIRFQGVIFNYYRKWRWG